VYDFKGLTADGEASGAGARHNVLPGGKNCR